MLYTFSLVELVKLDRELSQLIEGELSEQELLGRSAFLKKGYEVLRDSLLDCVFAHQLAALVERIALRISHQCYYPIQTVD